MNLEHPFLIYGLCKQDGGPLEDNEAYIHPIKAIMVKKDKPGVPRPEEVCDSGNEPRMRTSLKPNNLGIGYKQMPRERRDSHPPNPHNHPMRRTLPVLLLYSRTRSMT